MFFQSHRDEMIVSTDVNRCKLSTHVNKWFYHFPKFRRNDYFYVHFFNLINF